MWRAFLRRLYGWKVVAMVIDSFDWLALPLPCLIDLEGMSNGFSWLGIQKEVGHIVAVVDEDFLEFDIEL